VTIFSPDTQLVAASGGGHAISQCFANVRDWKRFTQFPAFGFFSLLIGLLAAIKDSLEALSTIKFLATIAQCAKRAL
jgi:hypothetical protein